MFMCLRIKGQSWSLMGRREHLLATVKIQMLSDSMNQGNDLLKLAGMSFFMRMFLSRIPRDQTLTLMMRCRWIIGMWN